MHSNGFIRCVFQGLVVIACLAASLKDAHADAHVALISELEGVVAVERGADTIPVETGTRLYTRDFIKTGPDGAVGIVFNDETTLSLGPGSELMIHTYIFDPPASQFAFVVHLFRGTAAYVSGLISKISPDSIRIITPSASIGVRGTRFLIEVEPI